MNSINKEFAYKWPEWFLKSVNTSTLATSILNNICNAQANLWKALNIYDDFLDEDGIPKTLPDANNHYRIFLKTLYTSNLPKEFINISESILDDLERANIEETSIKLIEIKNGVIEPPNDMPNFSNLNLLSRKSLSLAIMPIAAYLSAENKYDATIIETMLSFFRYLLSAKQLADDVYDWRDDLKDGKITAITVIILEDLKKNNLKVCLNDSKYLNKIFIEKVSSFSAHNILHLCKMARSQAYKLNIKKDSPILVNLIKPLEQTANKSILFKKML